MITTKDIEGMSVKGIVEDIGPMLSIMTPEAYKEALVKVWTKGRTKDAKRFLKRQFKYLNKRCLESKDHEVSIFLGYRVKEVVKEVNQAAKIIATEWKRREIVHKKRKEVK